MPQPPWPPVAYHGLYTKARRRSPHGMTQPPPEEALHAPLHPTRKLLESRVTLNNIFQHTQMDAERLNQLEARLENLGQRLEDLRGYL